MRVARWPLLGLVLAVCGACAARPSTMRPAIATLATQTQSVRSPQPSVSTVLPVPYVSQSVLLCGGAAIAMIERWWGRRGVFADDFGYLVRQTDGGILTSDMLTVMRARGWSAQAERTTVTVVRQSLADGVPVLALIRVAPKRYHYVVIVGWSSDSVTYHDPAVAPDVRVSAALFLSRWSGASAWAMRVTPMSAPSTVPVSRDTDTDTVRAGPVAALPCRPWLDDALDAAGANRLADAERLLRVAQGACPAESLVLRELAGIRFRQADYAESVQLADAYTQRVPGDSLGWQLLASSRWLSNDPRGALRDWNVIGRPMVDLVAIAGSGRTPYRTIARAIDVAPRDTLTVARLETARRRIADLPSLTSARLSYVPVPGGAVEVRAAVVEHPRLDPLTQVLVVEASRAVTTRQVFFGMSTPLGLGERWTIHWRWRAADPRVALQLDIPAQLLIPTVVRFERSWETFRFSDGVADEQRRASTLSVGGWARPDLEWRTGVRMERWSAARRYVALTAGGALHRSDDRLSLMAEAEHAVASTGRPSYDRLGSRLTWTTLPDAWANTWSLRLGGDWNSAATPRALWPIAGGGLMRSIPLRAHPLIVDNRLPSARIGQLVVHGGLAADRPLTRLRRLALGAGVFADAAHVARSADARGPSRLYVDVGIGVRVSVPGISWAAARVDLARGVASDRRWGITAAFLQPLPVRLTRPR